MSLGQIREILIRRDKDLSLRLYYAGGGKEIRAHVTGDLAQLGTNPPQSSVTEDIGYYDYRPVTLLFACFISFQRYALS